jgi:hypothetical protein
MKKLLLLLLQVFILFVFVGCTSSVTNIQTKEPISVTIQQLGKTEKTIKITDNDDLNLIFDCIQSVKWTSNVPLPSVPKEDGYVTFQYNTYDKDNKLSDDNPYKVWVNGDRSITIESFRGKVGTISKEEMTKYELIFKYLETK